MKKTIAVVVFAVLVMTLFSGCANFTGKVIDALRSFSDNSQRDIPLSAHKVANSMSGVEIGLGMTKSQADALLGDGKLFDADNNGYYYEVAGINLCYYGGKVASIDIYDVDDGSENWNLFGIKIGMDYEQVQDFAGIQNPTSMDYSFLFFDADGKPVTTREKSSYMYYIYTDKREPVSFLSLTDTWWDDNIFVQAEDALTPEATTTVSEQKAVHTESGIEIWLGMTMFEADQLLGDSTRFDKMNQGIYYYDYGATIYYYNDVIVSIDFFTEDKGAKNWEIVGIQLGSDDDDVLALDRVQVYEGETWRYLFYDVNEKRTWDYEKTMYYIFFECSEDTVNYMGMTDRWWRENVFMYSSSEGTESIPLSYRNAVDAAQSQGV